MTRLLERVLCDDGVRNWLLDSASVAALSTEGLSSAALCTMSPRAAPSFDAQDVLIVPTHYSADLYFALMYSEKSTSEAVLQCLRVPDGPPTARPVSHRLVLDLSKVGQVEWVEGEWLDDGSLVLSENSVNRLGTYTSQSVLVDGPPSSSGVPSHVICTFQSCERANCERCAHRSECECIPFWKRSKCSGVSCGSGRGNSTSAGRKLVNSLCLARTANAMKDIKITVPSISGAVRQNLRVNLSNRCMPWKSDQIDLMRRKMLKSLGLFEQHPALDFQLFHAITDNDGSEQRSHIADFTDCTVSEDGDDLLIGPVYEPPNKSSIVEQAFGDDKLPLVPTKTSSFEEGNGDDTEAVPEVDFSVVPTCTSTASATNSFRDTNSSSGLTDMATQVPEGEYTSTSRVPMRTGVKKELKLRKKPFKRKAKSRLYCDECSMTFRHHGHWQEHRLAVHQRMRPHTCELCPPGSTSSFAKKNDWYRHRQRVHNIPKTYPCNEHGCAAVFSQKVLLHRHVRDAHRLRKPFPCNLCALSYSRKSSLKKHLVDKHCKYVPE